MEKCGRARRGILDGTEGVKRAREGVEWRRKVQNGLEGRKKAQDSALDGVGDSDSAWKEE